MTDSTLVPRTFSSRAELLEVITPGLAEKLNVDPALVVEDASFADDLDADSLDLVEVVMQLEDDIGLKIPDKDLEKLTTVGASLDYLWGVLEAQRLSRQPL